MIDKVVHPLFNDFQSKLIQKFLAYKLLYTNKVSVYWYQVNNFPKTPINCSKYL